jgi:hypothetical protein
MKMIKGLTVTDSILTSSTVAENDATEWDGTGGLAAGTERMVTTTANGAASATHKVYEVAVGGDSSVDPTTDSGTNWIDNGNTNRYKMFNDVVQDTTTKSGGFTVELSSSSTFVTGVAFLNVTAATIVLDVVFGGDTLFSETYTMTEPPSETGFWWWLFDPIERKTSLYVDNLPTILGTDITAEFTGSGDVSCGIMSIGYSQFVGESVFGHNYSVVDYSVATENETTGRVTITRGANRTVVDAPVVVMNSRFGAVTRMLNESLSTPRAWQLSPDYPLVYGFYKRYDQMTSNAAFSDLALRIEGLV